MCLGVWGQILRINNLSIICIIIMHIFCRQEPQLNTLKRQWPSYLPAFSCQTHVPEPWTSPLATVHQLTAERAQWRRLIVPLCSLGFRRMNSGRFPSRGNWYPRSSYQLMIAMINLKFSNAIVQPLNQVRLCDPMDCSIQSNVTSLFFLISGIS